MHQSQQTGATVYAVADGHGGHAVGHMVSEYISRTLISTLEATEALNEPSSFTERHINTAVEKIDNNSISLTSSQREYAGSTLCSVIRHPASLVCFNVGDSRAILVSIPPDANKPHAVQLTTDHVCSDRRELARINRAGGVVDGGLLNGYISMTRAIGDEDLKAHRNITQYPSPGAGNYTSELFISEADVNHRAIQSHDVCIVVASDGIWNRLSNNDVSSIICKALANGKNVSDAARAVTQQAFRKGSEDNATVVIGLLTSLPEAISLISQTTAFSKKLRKVIDSDSSHSPKSIIDFNSDVHSTIDLNSSGSIMHSIAGFSTSIPSTPGSPVTPFSPGSRTGKKMRFRKKKSDDSRRDATVERGSPRLEDRKPREEKPSKPTSMTRRLANRIRSTHT